MRGVNYFPPSEYSQEIEYHPRFGKDKYLHAGRTGTKLINLYCKYLMGSSGPQLLPIPMPNLICPSNIAPVSI